ncbi:MAG: amino acid ABC transporter ATP-binding protein [Planctomycetota bacterium]
MELDHALNASPGQHITITNLSKRYGSRTVLDGISLQIEPGETVALIGPSGGGKSTLLRCLNGLSSFDSGTIQVGTHTLGPSSSRATLSAVRRIFGMIFQDFQLFPHMTALQNVMEAPLQVAREPRDRARRRAIELLSQVGLSDHQDAFPQQLSGGQKQRVAIARALAMEPRGLLCDEITSALDPELKADVLAALVGLKQQGLTLIVVTHEILFARRAADRVCILADGQIIEQGPPEQVLVNPQTDRAKKFLSDVLA